MSNFLFRNNDVPGNIKELKQAIKDGLTTLEKVIEGLYEGMPALEILRAQGWSESNIGCSDAYDLLSPKSNRRYYSVATKGWVDEPVGY